MGIERFFSSLNKDFDVVSDLTKPYDKINCTHFMIDFNSIIHNVSSKMISKKDYKAIDTFEIELVTNIKLQIIDMLKNNIISDNLEYIMLAIDGVPSFAKMMEQKKRRYIGDLMNLLLRDVELPINWSKNNISPGTQFMDTLCSELKKKEFMDECKTVCINLTGILVSDVYNPGEGEMKIVNCLKGIKTSNSKICVYSPDSDMILLLLLLDLPVNLLRYDQQQSKIKKMEIYNLIDVNKFKRELINYCITRLGDIKDKQNIINEIVYIFTLFGDDFLPKIESIQVGSDINYLLDNYLLTLKDRGNILIKKRNGEYDLNIDGIKHLFNLLTRTELLDLNRNFYESKFKNYRYATNNNMNMDLNLIKKNVGKIIVKFIARHSSLNRTGQVCTPLNVSTCIDVSHFHEFFLSKYDSNKMDFNKVISENKSKSDKYNFNKDIYKELIDNINSMKKFGQPFHLFLYNITKILDGDKLYQALYGDNILSSSLKTKKNIKFMEVINKYKSLYYLKLKPIDLINELILYFYLYPMDYPILSYNINNVINYQTLFKREFNSSSHKKKMSKLGYNDKNKKRDRLEYMINNKLDDYYYLFNPINSFYTNKLKSTNGYYEDMFPRKDKNNIINKYVEGFYWVLNYYINNKVNNMWFYPFARTPLLSDLKNADFEDRLKYDNVVTFNPMESIIFITPLESSGSLDFLPDKVSDESKKRILHFINRNQHFFLPLSEIKTKLIEDIKGLPDLLDCSVSIFISKCHYKLLEENVNPELYIKKFRESLSLEDQEIRNVETFKCIELDI